MHSAALKYAQKYAKAVFDLADGLAEQEAYLLCFDIFLNAISSHRLFYKLENPRRQAALYQLMLDLQAQYQFPPAFCQLIGWLGKRRQLQWLPLIRQFYRQFYYTAQGVVHIVIHSLPSLSTEYKNKIETQLKEKISGQCHFEWQDNPHLLAGFVVTFRNKRLDLSLKGCMDRFYLQMKDKL